MFTLINFQVNLLQLILSTWKKKKKLIPVIFAER
jgi:hypothetical protein